MSEITDKDRAFVWHPFTHLFYAAPPINVTRSEGTYYITEEGMKYIDAISSWWVNIHGHSHPYIAEGIYSQAKQNAHSIFSGFTHPQAVRLAERLINILPLNQKKVFFSDDGSTSVEVAIKMALQYFFNKGEKRTKIIAFENAYHGDTFGGMSAGARNVFNEAFGSLLFDVIHLPLPNENNFQNVAEVLNSEAKKGDVAAFIFEPLVQGAAGMRMYEAKHLDSLIKICREHSVICIADEVMTGFGRTGKMFASEYLSEKPDVICLSKGITGGFMPLGVTTCSQFVFDAFVSADKHKTFYHGHSYTANPLACAAANASLDLFDKENTLSRIKEIELAHKNVAQRLSSANKNWEVKHKGTILSFTCTNEKSEYLSSAGERAAKFLFDKGILIRPLGNVFYLLPPYCISADDLNYIYSVIEDFLKQDAEQQT